MDIGTFDPTTDIVMGKPMRHKQRLTVAFRDKNTNEPFSFVVPAMVTDMDTKQISLDFELLEQKLEQTLAHVVSHCATHSQRLFHKDLSEKDIWEHTRPVSMTLDCSTHFHCDEVSQNVVNNLCECVITLHGYRIVNQELALFLTVDEVAPIEEETVFSSYFVADA
tara:strand:+ start:617 stop:1114 length:498 start_codon:yes stop_codon:yes gene_type:complete